MHKNEIVTRQGKTHTGKIPDNVGYHGVSGVTRKPRKNQKLNIPKSWKVRDIRNNQNGN